MPDYIPPPDTLPPGSLVWAYVRDSGGNEQEQSVPQQESEIRAYCKTYGLVIRRVYKDVAKSAKSTKRRNEFNAMIDAITADDHPAGLLVFSLSRFSRNIDDSAYFKAHLRRHNVVIHSLTDQIPEGLAGRIVESVQDYSNADYLVQNAKAVKRALETNVRNGFTSGGIAPRGYKREKVAIGTRRDGSPRMVSRLAPDPELWELVKLAWKLKAEGKAISEITKATSGKVYKNAGSWTTFFKNKTYLGIGKCGKVEVPDHHEPAVSLEDWQKVQTIMKDRASQFRGLSHPRRQRYPSLLSGLAVCKRCGASFIHHIGRTKYPGKQYYICGNRDRRRGIKDCDNPRVMAKRIDGLVLDTVLMRILTPSFAEEILEKLEMRFSNTDTLQEEIKRKRYELTEKKRAINNLLDLAENFGARSAQERLKQREIERAVLETEIKSLEAQKKNSEITVTPEALALVVETWRNDVLEAKKNENVAALRSLLAHFISRIEIDYHQAEIWYTFPKGGITPIVKGLPGGTEYIETAQRYLLSGFYIRLQIVGKSLRYGFRTAIVEPLLSPSGSWLDENW